MHSLLTSSKTHAQFARYFMAAGIGLVIDFAGVIIAKEVFGLHYLLAVCTGFTLGLAVTYFLSNKFVFGKPKDKTEKAFLLFGLIGIVGLGILNIIVWLLTGQFGVNYIVSKCIATIAVFLWNFFARKTLYDPQEIKLPYEL